MYIRSSLQIPHDCTHFIEAQLIRAISYKIRRGGPPPSSEICKIFSRGDPYYYLHISEEGGGALPLRMCLIGLPDEALYYSNIYPNSCDLGTAHASLAFGQLRT